MPWWGPLVRGSEVRKRAAWMQARSAELLGEPHAERHGTQPRSCMWGRRVAGVHNC